MGAPKGPRNKANKGSVNDIISQMQVGARIYIETTKEKYRATERIWNRPKSRRPAFTVDWVFRTSVYTAVGSAVGDVRYLVCLERLK